MRLVFQIVSWIALAGTIVPSLMYLGQKMDLNQATTVLNVATVAWFIATPLWMGRKPESV
jgi:uncharacterized membrane protein YfcA